MRITSVHHIQLQFPAQSTEDLRFFYSTVLGAQELPVPHQRQLLQFAVGEQLLCFSPAASPAPRSACQHVAFNVQGIDDLKNRFQAFGWHIIATQPSSTGLQAQQVYVKDPAGHQLEFLESH